MLFGKKARSLCFVVAALFVATEAVGQVPRDEVSPFAPLSSMVSVYVRGGIPRLVKKRVAEYAKDELPANVEFPLRSSMADRVRAIEPMRVTVVAKWLDPLTNDRSLDAPRFGANCDFITFFGDGWDADWENGAVGSGPAFSGSSRSGWIWSNHEYISNSYPTTSSAPSGQHMTFAQWLRNMGALTNNVSSDVWAQADVDQYVRWHKRQLGGSWFRVERNAIGEWYIDRDADAKRYDATSETLTHIVGYDITRPSKDDQGNALPMNVVPGIAGDCSGGQTPWGTVITAEENVQGYYGDFETAWDGNNRFISGQGFDPGAVINPDPTPGNSTSEAFGMTSNADERKDRDNYGFLVEIDPGQEPGDYYESANVGGDGAGHRKIGTMGRVRWENATVAVNGEFALEPGQPVVVYGANDRRSGRIYKFVSSQPFTAGMTKADVRALLDEGRLYVAHFAGLDHATGTTLYDPANPDGGGVTPTEAAPGQGVWIRMSVDNNDDAAPNAPALGPGTTVGQALRDVNWNGIGGFATDNDVLGALFTAANKIGVAELNRPEDVDYNPNDFSGNPRVYVAFTNHTRPAVNNQDGALDPDTPRRNDNDGSIFAMEESDPNAPGASRAFTFWMVWKGGVPASSDDSGLFIAGDPDNLAIDRDGGVWFGTDGHAGSTGDTRSDAIYYLDLDPAHKAGEPGVVNPTYGLPFRVVASPGDSEATGPWFVPDMSTLFFNVQHPGEDVVRTPSTWPQNRDYQPGTRRYFFKDRD